MSIKINRIIFVALFLMFASYANAQDKHVTITQIEVNGKAISSKFTVRIIDGEKVTDAKIDETGFTLPAEAVGKTLGVIIEFKKHKLLFFFVTADKFDSSWIVGVETKKPFDPDLIGEADRSKT